MCGIYGVFNNNCNNYSFLKNSVKKLSELSYQRGKEAAGLAVLLDENLKIIKSDLNGKLLFKTSEYNFLETKIKDKPFKVLIGHSRIATHGSQLDTLNNQPVTSSDSQFVIVHNGIITNKEDLWTKMGMSKDEIPELDTQVLIDYFSFLYQKLENYGVVLKALIKDIEGSMSIAIISVKDGALILSSNTGSLHYYKDKQENIYFASEQLFLKKIIGKEKFNQIRQINHGHIEIFKKEESEVDIPSFQINDYSPPKNMSSAIHLYTYKNDFEKIKKHNFDYESIYNIRRCTKCILPQTTPFIQFNKDGVCNFCEEHQKISTLGKITLEDRIAPYRKGNGEPDCIAAFSGGRDSSYGLHYLKNELGMTPLAYTYDWGMVTDVARRNQARILGKLGVEHIVVSADITMKRKHIRKHILAWIKKPDLGMVPLFMEGDKQCEFHANKLMKNYNIPLMFFFRGNELEREEFKNGHCGIKDADQGGVIHHLPALDKLKLLKYYGKQYLSNPSYINSSIFDTALAYFSTYIQKHDYLYLWHYIPWEEDIIISTLRNEYNWELSKETNQTWRTDDGSSAFYNYIYYQVQGFTENDSFRSRQIREGLLTREEALKLVSEENKPRYEALLWYFDMIGLDGDKVLTVVDRIPKLYSK